MLNRDVPWRTEAGQERGGKVEGREERQEKGKERPRKEAPQILFAALLKTFISCPPGAGVLRLEGPAATHGGKSCLRHCVCVSQSNSPANCCVVTAVACKGAVRRRGIACQVHPGEVGRGNQCLAATPHVPLPLELEAGGRRKAKGSSVGSPIWLALWFRLWCVSLRHIVHCTALWGHVKYV